MRFRAGDGAECRHLLETVGAYAEVSLDLMLGGMLQLDSISWDLSGGTGEILGRGWMAGIISLRAVRRGSSASRAGWSTRPWLSGEIALVRSWSQTTPIFAVLGDTYLRRAMAQILQGRKARLQSMAPIFAFKIRV